MSKNRFAGLSAARELQETKQTQEPAAKANQTSQVSALPEQTTTSNAASAAPTARRGRPNGKRSDAEFQQVTAYVRRDTYRKVTVKLVDQPQKGEFSELVQELLHKWLEQE